ncbi:MAG: sugar phosphate isomerase/epimerase [Lachnospiraceae bacterium]|nr:sugar phosphate isomerase/epimerase [Lachnospiraceae bacterium]
MMRLFIRAHDLGVKGEKRVIERLCELGLDGVQLVAYKVLPEVAYKPGAMDARRAREIAETFAMAGKSIPLIGAYFNPVHPDEEKVKNGAAVFRDYLRLAHDFGCDTVGSETGSVNGDPWIYHPGNDTEEAFVKTVNIFAELCDCAKDYGAYVGMEGAAGHVCYDVKRLARAVRETGRDNIKIIFDLFNYLKPSNIEKRYEILAEGLQTFGDRICVFHIKDCVIEKDGSLKQCGVGKGIFDYSKILSEIKKVCPDANLVFEGTVGEDIADAIAHIRQRL